jgi:MarR family transcriptional regulator, negative regulator of the multidrug operon emrRAB
MHMFPTSEQRRAANLTGALVLALADGLHEQLDSDSTALVTLLERGPSTVEFLRRVIGLSHSATVRLVDRLGDEDLLERGPGPDARSITVRLTRRGRGRAAALRRRREEVLSEALAPLDEGERRQLGRLAEKILGSLTRGREHARFTCRLCDHGVCRAGGRCPVDHAAAVLGQ